MVRELRRPGGTFRRRCTRFALLLPLLGLCASNAVADTSPWEECATAKQKQSVIDACTAYLDSGMPLDLEKRKLALIRRGNAYYEGYYQAGWPLSAARSDLDLAIQLDPNDGRSYLARGKMFLSWFDGPRAVADLSEAIRLDPGSSEAFFLRARAVFFRELGIQDSARALADLNEAIRLNPQHYLALYLRGRVHGAMGSEDLALADFTAAIEGDPGSSARAERASIYMERGEYDRAIADYDALNRKGEPFSHWEDNRGLAYLKKGDDERALQDLTVCMERHNTPWYTNSTPDEDCLFNRGWLHHRRGELDLAIADYDRILNRPHQRLNSESYILRGEAYWAKGDYGRALADFESAIADIEADRSGYESRLERNQRAHAVSRNLADAITGRDKARAAIASTRK